MIKVTCKTCGKVLDIPEKYAGQTGKCNGCGGDVFVPLVNNVLDDIPPAKAYPQVATTPDIDWTERAKNIGIASCAGCIVIPVALFGVLFIIGLFASAGQQSTTPRRAPQSFTSTPAATTAPRADNITLAQFNQIENGMTYQQVVSILGRDGTVMSENTLPNPLGGQIHTIMYIWENSAFQGNMNAMFQNGALMQKAQFGLK